VAPCAPNIRCESRARRCGGATVRAARIYCSLRFIRPPRRLTSCDNGRVGCRALGLGHRKPARLAFERIQVLGEGAPDDLQGHRLAADGAGYFVAGCWILTHCVLMHATADSGLDVDQPTPASAPSKPTDGVSARRMDEPVRPPAHPRAARKLKDDHQGRCKRLLEMRVSPDEAAEIYASACHVWYRDRAPRAVSEKIHHLRKRGDTSGVKAWTKVAEQLTKLRHRRDKPSTAR